MLLAGALYSGGSMNRHAGEFSPVRTFSIVDWLDEQQMSYALTACLEHETRD
jgi:hypothetical protein